MKPALASRHRRSVAAWSRSIWSKSGVRTGCAVAWTAEISRQTSAVTALSEVRHVAAMATILHSADRTLRALVGARQPLAEEPRGFVRRRPVERHERRGQAGDADDVGTPAVLRDRGPLDE